jgi:hypothetical protein
MFQDAFVKLEGEESEAVLAAVNPAISGGDYNAKTATVLAHDLSFYKGYKFLDIANYDAMPAFRKFVIYKEGDVVVLDWTNKPLYDLNKRAPIDINEKNITEYTRFFFSYVRGRHGRFIVAETVDDINWSEEPPPAVRKAIGQLLEPVQLVEEHDDGTYKLDICLVFKKALYKTHVSVDKDGIVNIEKEEFLLDDIPALDDTLAL